MKFSSLFVWSLTVAVSLASLPLQSVSQAIPNQESIELILTIAGNGTPAFSGDGGSAQDASLSYPWGIAVSPLGSMYIVDHTNQRIRFVDSLGNITTIAGTGTNTFSGDGEPAINAALNNPNGICMDAAGNLYIADTFNNRVRKISNSGIITTVAGNGEIGYSGDGYPATEARLNKPFDVGIDSQGNLFIADTGNNVIRKVSTNGIITTVAGTGQNGYSGDGDAAIRAKLQAPNGVFVDHSGELLIADTGNHVIRKVPLSGFIYTIAGTGTGGYTGDNGLAIDANLNQPSDIFVDSLGNLFIADTANHVIRKVDTSGEIITIAGNGNAGYSGDGGSPVNAALNHPSSITVDSSGNLLITDTRNHCIRMVTVAPPVSAAAETTQNNGITPVNVPIQLDGIAEGGDGSYVYDWSVRSGPIVDLSQFSSTTVEDPTFTPFAAGTYVLEFTVDDQIQPPVTTTLAVIALAVNPVNSVFVSDTVDSLADVSNAIDYDPIESKELVVRWNFNPDLVDFSDVGDIHVYIKVDGGNFTFLGRTGTGNAEYLEWQQTTSNFIAESFRDGPQFDHSYQFRVYFISKSGGPFYGPFENAGPVQFLEDVIEPTPTPEPIQPTNTPLPVEPTNTPEPIEPTNTPLPVVPTDTPEPVQPTNTPEPIEPTNTPEPAGPTNTPGPEEPTNTPEPVEPTNTPEPEEPTATPEPGEPTNTPEPGEPTNTPEPVEPTNTPEPGEPTNTPEPVDPTTVPTSTNTPTPTLTHTPTLTPTNTTTPTPLPTVPIIHIEPVRLEFYSSTSSMGNLSQPFAESGETPDINENDFTIAETTADGRILVWGSFSPDVDFQVLRAQILDNGGEILSLSPEGKLLIAIAEINLPNLTSLQVIDSVSPFPQREESSSTSPTEDFGLGASPPTKEEEQFIQDNFDLATELEPNSLSMMRAQLAGEAGTPSAVDNSASQFFPPVRSQGGQGSCTCWAACYYYNTFTQAKDENLNAASGDNDNICSPAFMYPIINGGRDQGAYTSEAVRRLSEIGCCSWSKKPYSSSDYTSWPSEEAWVDALKRRTINNYTIYGTSDSGIAAIKQHLANGNIAVTQCPVYTNWYYWRDNQNRGIQNGVLFSHANESLVGYHAMTIVGYDDNRPYNTGSETRYGAFLITNSWGSNWGTYNSTGTGTRGFMWVADVYFKNYFRYAFYNDDRDDYRPQMFAVNGLNHSQRGRVAHRGGIGNSDEPTWTSHYTIQYDGGSSIAIDDSKPVAVDLTEGISSITNLGTFSLFTQFVLSSGASGNGSISNGIFYHDLDGDGTYQSFISEDANVNVPPGSSGYTAVAISYANDTASFVISNLGSVPLAVNSISLDSEASWVEWSPAAPFEVAGGGSQTVTVTLDWDQAPDGQSTSRLLVESDDYSGNSPYAGGVDLVMNKIDIPTPTPSNTPLPTNTPSNTPTITPIPPNTNTPTPAPIVPTNTPPEPVEPTNTPTPIPVGPTNTPAPNTPTPEPVTPTASPTSQPVEPTNTPEPSEPTNTPEPAEPTNTPEPAGPTGTPTQGPEEPTNTPSPEPVEPTNTPEPVATSTPVVTSTPEIPTHTPTPTPPQTEHHYAFEPLGTSLEDHGFSTQPADADVTIAEIPFNQDQPNATNGVGLKCLPSQGELLTLTGSPITVLENPVSISVWYNASAEGFQIALGAYAEMDNQFGAAGYTVRKVPEYEPGVWQRTEIVIGNQYSRVTPFLVIFNGSDSDKSIVYADNLYVVQGNALSNGDVIEPTEWVPNLWLDPQEAGNAYQDGDTLVLEKDADKKAARFATYYSQGTFPNRVNVEVDMIKDSGATGNLTLWIGNGPSATQSDVPLQLLNTGEQETLFLSAVTASNPGDMNIVIQIAGQDTERVRITDVRIYESALESTFNQLPEM